MTAAFENGSFVTEIVSYKRRYSGYWGRHRAMADNCMPLMRRSCSDSIASDVVCCKDGLKSRSNGDNNL